MKKIISYNVNGIRAAGRKGFYDWIAEVSPDIICLQEIKAQPDQLEAAYLKPPGYQTYWYPAEKKGYSGVAIFSKEVPSKVSYGCGIQAYDKEGRVLMLDFPDFSVISAYFPSGSSGDERQVVKEAFLDDFYNYTRDLMKTHSRLVISGDYNICHRPIDIHDPVRNKNVSGFLPHEREWMSKYMELGLVDTFRLLHPDTPDRYSWWSYRAGARARNKGWRIDYHLVSQPLAEKVIKADILDQVVHSDHCPIEVVIDL